MTTGGKENIVNRIVDATNSHNHYKSCTIDKVEQKSSNGYKTVSSHPFDIGKIDKHYFNLEVSE